MATSASTLAYLVGQFGPSVTAKRMFGEAALYRNGVLFALVCDDRLFVKATAQGRKFLGEVEEVPPYPGAKNAFLISDDAWNDDRWLRDLARITADALPPPKTKVPKVSAKAKAKAPTKAKAPKTSK